MTYLDIVSIALDEAFAMDGDENAVRSSGWLQEHDERYHGGHYEEGDRCKLRERLSSTDNADRLGGAGNALSMLRNAPSRNQFDSLIDRLQRSGVLVGEDVDDITRMVRSAFNAIGRADDDDYDGHGELRDNLIALNEVYQALNQAYPQQAAASAAPANGQQSDAPTQEQTLAETPTRVPAIRRLVGNYRDRLSQVGNGGFPEAQNWNRQIQRVVGNPTTSECIKELLDHPERPQYRDLLDRYTQVGLAHPTSWAGRFMGTVERLHPNWRSGRVDTTPSRNAQNSQFTVALDEAELAQLSRCSNDAERAEVALRSYNRRNALGQTSHIEDVFHASGIHCLGPGKINPVGYNADGCCCFACHAVTAMRQLYGAVCNPNSTWNDYGGRNDRGSIWFEVRCKAFYGAIPLETPEQSEREINNAPDGSVIMTTDGGHCYNYTKENGAWYQSDTYSGSHIQYNVSGNNLAFAANAEQVERANTSRIVTKIVTEGGVPENMPRGIVAMAGKGSMLITPNNANKVNPEYLVGAVTGKAHDYEHITPALRRIFNMMRGAGAGARDRRLADIQV